MTCLKMTGNERYMKGTNTAVLVVVLREVGVTLLLCITCRQKAARVRIVWKTERYYVQVATGSITKDMVIAKAMSTQILFSKEGVCHTYLEPENSIDNPLPTPESDMIQCSGVLVLRGKFFLGRLLSFPPPFYLPRIIKTPLQDIDD